jgi:hypothetical protein
MIQQNRKNTCQFNKLESFKMPKMYQLLLIGSALMLSACSFVKLTQGGEKVRILESSEVSTCKHLGQSTANTQEKALGVRRHDTVIHNELSNLARNTAAKMGGDTIVAEGPEVAGKQTFLIYKCVGQ